MTTEMTPNDVREAARTALDKRQDYAEQHGHPTFQDEPSAYLNGFEDGVAFDVRLRETAPRAQISDAEVNAALIAYWGSSDGRSDSEFYDMRAALEAAREARP